MVIIDPGHGWYLDGSTETHHYQRSVMYFEDDVVKENKNQLPPGGIEWYVEDEGTLDIARATVSRLLREGVEVVTTRDLLQTVKSECGYSYIAKQEAQWSNTMTGLGDASASLTPDGAGVKEDVNTRVAYAKHIKKVAAERNYDEVILVSIHTNAFEDSSVNGVETFFYNFTVLAEKVQEAVVSATGWRDRKTKWSDEHGITKPTAIPSVLIECGFHTNPDELRALMDGSQRAKIGEAIAQGILNYFQYGRSSGS